MATAVQLAFLSLLIVSTADALIPHGCHNLEQLEARECCPVPQNIAGADRCGQNLGRGECTTFTSPPMSNDNVPDTDLRKRWPLQLFNKSCNCNGNFGGFDCGECKFGYTGESCTEQRVRIRKSLDNMTEDDWNRYRYVLDRVKRTIVSRYWVVSNAFSEQVLLKPLPAAVKASLVRPNLYNLFIWMHHFAAKDNPDMSQTKVDFAHEATGFLTWHRLFLLWFEREIQLSINDPEFTLSYWDWTKEEEREAYFKTGRLSISDSPFSEWDTYCWPTTEPNAAETIVTEICNPMVSSNQALRRCPDRLACMKSNSLWPNQTDIEDGLIKSEYDVKPYDKYSTNSFRAFLEGFLLVDSCTDRSLCTTEDKHSVDRKLHNTVHILLGLGNSLNSGIPYNEKGVMADVAASPNDPIFINHHAMIDCIFEEWMKCHNPHNRMKYPTGVLFEGHRANDYIVPFFPTYTHSDIFKGSETFGYKCEGLKGFVCKDDDDGASAITSGGVVPIIVLGVVGIIVTQI